MTIRDNVRDGICWIIDHREGGKPAAFARRIDIDRAKVGNWKAGRNAPDLEMLGYIARVYGLSLDWLIGGDPDKAPTDYEHARGEVDEDA
ncbi:helix-turn-helix transcriptional regulator [Paratractidigestivibacter sp.]|uniref:helix-turn-helix domain-containing protein n=1 Tax=Paratractidigestivibacter sp. TaxID=2847316 RepID=UPI002ABD7CCB|nr:helix-turn-helix transcriptional regulator [Paratractidigestivibacter sp.]